MAEKAILPVTRLRAWVRKMGPTASGKAAEAALTRILGIVEAKAVELSPVDTGNLDASTVVEVEPVTRGAKKLVGHVSFVAPYAFTQHEGVDWRTGKPLEPGVYTARKPGNELGQAGPKYLERALRGANKYMPKLLADLVQKALLVRLD